jgi:hypothetical protein
MFLTPELETRFVKTVLDQPMSIVLTKSNSGLNSMTITSLSHQNRKFSMSRPSSYFTSFNHWHEDVP